MVISGVNTVTYNGDGITTAWPFTFPVTNDSEIRVQLNNADGTAVIVDSDYYVDIVNSTVYYPGYAPGAEPPEAEQPPKVQEGQTITVYREIPMTQEANLGEKWPFAVIEKGLDKLTMIAQQIDSGTKRILDNALASLMLLADVVVDSDELQHITDQLNTIDEKAEDAAESEANALAYKNAAASSATNAANSASAADTTATALTTWLEDKETLTAPAVDPTLSILGAAADAQETGRKIRNSVSITSSNYAANLPDLNGISAGGRHILNFANGATSIPLNTPFGASWGGTLALLNTTFIVAGTYGVQLFYDLSNGVLYSRIYASGTWLSWKAMPQLLSVPGTSDTAGMTQNAISSNFFNSNLITINSSTYLATLADFDNALKNRIYLCLFANGSTSIPANSPYDDTWKPTIAILFTFFSSDGTYGYQVVLDDNGAAYYRRCASGTWASWGRISKNKTITITSGANLIAKLKTVEDGDTVIFNGGNYDIMAKYTQYYGNDFWDNYAGYAGETDEFLQGLPLKRGVTWICSPKAFFTATYSGANANVAKYFSAVAAGDGFKVVGLNLHTSGLRYAIHDDFNKSSNPYVSEYQNCIVIDDTKRAIGGGFGAQGNYIIHGCYFKGNGISISYHNNVVSACNHMDISGNYFDGKVSLRYYGTSTQNSTVMLSNNSMSENYELIPEAEGATENIQVYAWNNEIRA